MHILDIVLFIMTITFKNVFFSTKLFLRNSYTKNDIIFFSIYI